MRSTARRVLASAFIALLAGCAGAPPPTDRTVPNDASTVRDRVVDELRALGLGPSVGSDGVISARTGNAPTEWASCSPALVGRGGDHNSKRLVSVRSRQAVIRVALAPAGAATRVDVMVTFTASYDNPETATGFERACRSRGVVEARLLAAAAG